MHDAYYLYKPIVKKVKTQFDKNPWRILHNNFRTGPVWAYQMACEKHSIYVGKLEETATSASSDADTAAAIEEDEEDSTQS